MLARARRISKIARLVVLLVVALALPAAAVPTFSLDFASPTLPAFLVTESDIFLPGPIGGPPALLIPAAAIGLIGLGVDDINAMTVPGGLGLLHFSLARGSVGLPVAPPDVVSEAAAGQEAADVFIAAQASPQNQLAFNQDILGLIPAVAPGVASLPPIDSIDALDLSGGIPAFFALAAGHPYLGSAVGCGADVFAPGPALAITAAGLGLACVDDIDAMHIDSLVAAFDVYFSLAPGSPSLAPGSGIPACFALGCSAADIFLAPGGVGPALLYLPAGALGLTPGDDIDALAFEACPGFAGADLDLDGIDDGCDNCLGAANFFQWDSNADGYGNSCDPDYDGVAPVSIPDFGTFKMGFGAGVGAATYDPDTDHDNSGVTGIPDFGVFKMFFGGPPGPSALPCAGAVPCTH